MSIVQHLNILPLEVKCSWKCDYECHSRGWRSVQNTILLKLADFRSSWYPIRFSFCTSLAVIYLKTPWTFHYSLTATEWSALNSSTILVCSRWFTCISVIIVEPSLDDYHLVQLGLNVASCHLLMYMAECYAKYKLHRQCDWYSGRGTEPHLFSWTAHGHELVGWLLHEVVR